MDNIDDYLTEDSRREIANAMMLSVDYKMNDIIMQMVMSFGYRIVRDDVGWTLIKDNG